GRQLAVWLAPPLHAVPHPPGRQPARLQSTPVASGIRGQRALSRGPPNRAHLASYPEHRAPARQGSRLPPLGKRDYPDPVRPQTVTGPAATTASMTRPPSNRDNPGLRINRHPALLALPGPQDLAGR